MTCEQDFEKKKKCFQNFLQILYSIQVTELVLCFFHIFIGVDLSGEKMSQIFYFLEIKMLILSHFFFTINRWNNINNSILLGRD